MTFLLKTPYVFDVHIQDIYSAFAAGATLVIAPAGAHKDAREAAVGFHVRPSCWGVVQTHVPKRIGNRCSLRSMP